VCTFDPISFDSNCVYAAAALFAAGFATTTVCDPHVVTSAATLCTTRNRQFSLHLLIKLPDDNRLTKFLLTNTVTGEVESSTKSIG
jgi:hypothetical protein